MNRVKAIALSLTIILALALVFHLTQALADTGSGGGRKELHTLILRPRLRRHPRSGGGFCRRFSNHYPEVSTRIKG